MSRVGIMTWYRYENYGTALQACAMSKIIQQLGYEAYFINYRPKKAVENILDFSTILSKVKITLKDSMHPVYSTAERTALYNQFIEQNIKETKPCNTQPELNVLNDQFDAFLCGSDQIWAPTVFDEKYFLSFVKQDEKKVAYAPSIGLTIIRNEKIKKAMGELIKTFRHLSVREQQGAQLLNDYYGAKAEVVLDPTLLLSADEWDTFISQESLAKSKEIGKYLLCYFLNDEGRYQKETKDLAKKLGLKIIAIPTHKKSKLSKVPYEVGPDEFLALVKNAAYVCTDSFHGMAFSINYNIPFGVFPRFKENEKNNQNSRVFSLLNLLGMENRIVDASDFAVRCDFTKANKRLAKLRETSRDYLVKSLNQAIESPNETGFDYKITDNCCGCGICVKECARKAISIAWSEEGFQRYIIDKDKCVGCRACQSVCPFQKITAVDLRTISELYSFKDTAPDVLKSSSSGGASYCLNQVAIKKGMTVYGAVYNKETHEVEHQGVKEEKQLKEFQGSKYIQSKTCTAFSEMDFTNKDDSVIFTGTPCQVAGINNWLVRHKLREHAILVDLICHGVPSQNLWKSYLLQAKIKNGFGDNLSVTFRDKRRGSWRDLCMALQDSSGKQYASSEKKDDFYAFFRRSICNMRSCYECPYRDKSAADIRIADYWGSRFVKDQTGVSMVLPVTANGKQFLMEAMETDGVIASRQDIKEFWDNQYPYNLPFPLYYDDLMAELKNPTSDIHSLREKYCFWFDVQEKMVDILKKCRSLGSTK